MPEVDPIHWTKNRFAQYAVIGCLGRTPGWFGRRSLPILHNLPTDHRLASSSVLILPAHPRPFLTGFFDRPSAYTSAGVRIPSELCGLTSQ